MAKCCSKLSRLLDERVDGVKRFHGIKICSKYFVQKFHMRLFFMYINLHTLNYYTL